MNAPAPTRADRESALKGMGKTTATGTVTMARPSCKNEKQTHKKRPPAEAASGGLC